MFKLSSQSGFWVARLVSKEQRKTPAAGALTLTLTNWQGDHADSEGRDRGRDRGRSRGRGHGRGRGDGHGQYYDIQGLHAAQWVLAWL